MRIWAFVQQKGGSGKSTLCTNLAVHAEENGETVLIVDLDPQSSATLWHAQRGTNKPSVFEGLPDRLAEITQSAANLGTTLCLIDSPSKIDATALAAIRAADLVICPTLPDLFNLGSLQDTVRLLEAAEKLDATVGVINNVDGAGAAAKTAEVKAALASFNIVTSTAMVHHRTQFQAAVEKGAGVTEAGPRAKSAADEIRALWTFLERRAKQLDAGRTASKPPAKTKTRETSRS